MQTVTQPNNGFYDKSVGAVHEPLRCVSRDYQAYCSLVRTVLIG